MHFARARAQGAFMITKGFTCGRHGAVTLDEVLPDNLTSSYISVGTTAGAIVFENSSGNPQWCPFAFVGWNIIAARKILTSAVVDGATRETTAVGLGWAASGQPG